MSFKYLTQMYALSYAKETNHNIVNDLIVVLRYQGYRNVRNVYCVTVYFIWVCKFALDLRQFENYAE